jgi:hypothetical protein
VIPSLAEALQLLTSGTLMGLCLLLAAKGMLVAADAWNSRKQK